MIRFRYILFRLTLYVNRLLPRAWRWRKISRTEYPYRYIGPTTNFIRNGYPLRKVRGPSGATGGVRVEGPEDDYQRIVHEMNLEKR
jgi:hypothetical protein